MAMTLEDQEREVRRSVISETNRRLMLANLAWMEKHIETLRPEDRGTILCALQHLERKLRGIQ